MSSVKVVSVMILGCSFILCSSCGPPKALRLKAVSSTLISEQSSDMAVARDGRRKMRDERVVGGCEGSRMMIVSYRRGGLRAKQVGYSKAGGSQARRDKYGTSVDCKLADNGR